MTSPNYFIIRPYNGVRYDNIRKFGDVEFIISSSIEDHTVTNRLATVVSTPDWYKGPISKDDIVVVHHNTFRLYYNMNGNETSGWSYIKDDIYILDYEQIYLYKKEGTGWMATYPYCFIKPQQNDDTTTVLNHYVEKNLYGTVEFKPEEVNTVDVGDEISFKPGSEYEFKIDGDKLYRVKLNNICLKI